MNAKVDTATDQATLEAFKASKEFFEATSGETQEAIGEKPTTI
jgi:hypothetical protein